MTGPELAAVLCGGMDAASKAPAALKRLRAVGVETLDQAPLYLPTRFLDARRPIRRFAGLCPTPGDVVVTGRYNGDFETHWRPGRGSRRSPHGRGSLTGEDGVRLPFSLFGDARALQRSLAASNHEIALAGTLVVPGGQANGIVCLSNPVVVDPVLLGHVIPHYPGKSRVLATATARSLVSCLLPAAIPEAAAILRQRAREVVSDARLRRLLHRPHGTLDDLLWSAHLPASPEAGEEAQRSLERLSALLTVGDLRRLQDEHPPVRRKFRIGDWRELATRVPFTLTDEQVAAIDRLTGRFGGDVTSATLINADVGMGKSIVYQLACAALLRAGGRAAVLLPNERLAVQAHADIVRLFPELSARLVTGNTGGSTAGVAAGGPGDANWLVGTTALLFRDIGHVDVLVVDEQHRFSVEQRRALASDGTHVVEVSATPIPRTQALLLYGELDVIRLTRRHSPQSITTHVVTRDGAGDMVAELRGIVESGGRLLIVCPRREDADDDLGASLPSVARVAGKWQRLFPGLVRSLHGESPPEQAAQVFDDLATGTARILVATTVVEVGLNIADLRGLVVVHAERFGISQLHQLRGRLAREGGSARCFLYLPWPVGEDARLRLQAVAGTTDGFELAEHDMRIRGIGDVSATGERQHGSTGNLLLTRPVPMEIFMEMLEALRTSDSAASPARPAAV